MDARKNVLKFNYFTSTDGKKIRYGRADPLFVRKKGIVLLLNGRSEFMEKYNELVLELLAKRFSVFSLDWRGQGLSCRETENRHKGYVDSYEDYINDLNLFYHKFVKNERYPVLILAHSMGGHIALRFMGQYQPSIKKAFLVSPMIGIITSPFPVFFARFMARKACASGFSKSYVFGGGNYHEDNIKFETNNLTHDFDRFSVEKNEIQKNPKLALGDVTWGWLDASFQSIEILKTDSFVSQIKVPVCLISAEKDTIVSTPAQKMLCFRLPDCRFFSLPGAFHEILHETDAIRKMFWDIFDRCAGR
ncbi:MAG: alpha/beta hydrolase [Desulfobacteraceae bacterium]